MKDSGDRGASAVEYALLIGGVAALIIFVVFTLGANVRDTLFTTSCTALQSEIDGGTC